MTEIEGNAQILKQFDLLSRHDKLLLVEQLVRRMRESSFIDPEEFERQMDAMSKDPDIRRELGLGVYPADGSAASHPDVA
jgi:hypothetical protein